MLGLILRPVWQAQETTCLSTEEMLAEIKKTNESGDLDEDCTVGSADVTALYPSIDVAFAAEKVCEMFIESEVEVEEVDTRELGLYLALNRTRAQLRMKGLDEYCPERKTNRGRPPTITGCAQSKKASKRYRPWKNPVNDKPDRDATKRMLGEALAIAVCFVMRNHIYMFNGQAKRQRKGGPIGLGLTGDVAQVMMCWWDKKLIEKLRERGMDVLMYKRLVDDINMVLRRRGVVMDDVMEQADKRNMDFVAQVANSIHHSIQVTTDYPTKNANSKMPILDLGVWIQKMFDEVTHEVEVNVMHEYYYKEVATRAVVDARSAMPWSMKRTILTQEVVRVMRNCSRLLPWKDVCKHVEEFSMRMQFSGYDETFRAQVVRSALNAYNQMVAKDQQGEEPLYRPREWRKVERAKERRTKKGEWFRGADGKNETVVFVPATPRGELRRRFLQTIKRAKVKVAVAEVPGRSVKRRLQRSDPFRSEKCEDPGRCMVCEGKKGRCRSTGVTYEVRCKRCDDKYIGETARNAYTRGMEHRDGIEKRSKESPFHVHNMEKHGGVSEGAAGYEMKVTGVFGGDATKRQVAEAVRIQHARGELINRQDEWRQVKLPRIELSLL